jgi:hypothetical protein
MALRMEHAAFHVSTPLLMVHCLRPTPGHGRMAAAAEPIEHSYPDSAMGRPRTPMRGTQISVVIVGRLIRIFHR